MLRESKLLGLQRCVVVQSTCHGHDNRATEDAPLNAGDVLVQRTTLSDGYRLEAFLPASALNRLATTQPAEQTVGKWPSVTHLRTPPLMLADVR